MKIFILLVLIFFGPCLTAGHAAEDVSEAQVRALLGEALMMQGDYENSRGQYEEILKANPGDVQARIKYADLLTWQKQYPQAIQEYKTALAAHPDDLGVQEKLADVLTWNKEYKEAIDLYAGIAAKDQGNVELQVKLAEVYLWDLQYDKAQDLLRKILTIAPDHAKARLLLAKSMQYAGNPQEAIKIYQQLLSEMEKQKSP
jgi:tetratricopeptide (TPR) repeat protein